MAIAYEHVPSWKSDTLSRAIAERVELGLPTLVLDRRVVSDDVAVHNLAASAHAFLPGTTVSLADASSWVALIVPEPETVKYDLEGFARALSIWCGRLGASTAKHIPNFATASGNPRITDILKGLYGEDFQASAARQSISNEVVRHWRSTLRDLGEGPRAVIDDPWFSHLFLSPTAAELSLASPYTLLDLRSPLVPHRAAQKIIAVVFDRLLGQARHQHPVAPEIVCFIVEGSDLEPSLRIAATPPEKEGVNSPANVRLVWIDALEDKREAPKPTSTGSETPSKSDDDALYRMFTTTMDGRHRGAYVKGIMYGYSAFCTFEKADDLSNDLVFLREAGMILGMSSPLIELFDDC